jgi:2-polyprenyl-3-methyl-5-hydroxy-6-metoxy-1,4-benzoquinol methylase
MASVQAHYDTHLAPLYSWMSGGAEGPRARFAALLDELGLAPSGPGATAVDLGAGNGHQSLPLADAGFAVTAIDLSSALLAELAAAAGGRTVRTVHGDLRDFEQFLPSPAPEVIVCCGDTLTHLSSPADVDAMISRAARALAPGGWLVLGFRDYTVPREGTARFLPVQSDADCHLTCFLEYSVSHVTVHDLVHRREGARWTLSTSAYEKLRLAPDHVRRQLAAAGLTLVHDTAAHGAVTFAARRPSSLS